MIVFAVALVFNLPAGIQRAIPDYTAALQGKVVDGGQALEDLASGTSSPANAELANCDSGGAELENCGAAPDISGATGWLNTPGGAPIDIKALHGKVVLVDFWAYSCINCQRAIPHVVDWYKAYKDAGFEVIGVHTPEYAFEHVPGNVTSGAAGLGITYPIALDNDYSIWDNFHNQAWPAEYLIDANGTIRHIAIGEGEYDVTEGLIRQLLTAAHPGVALPSPTTSVDTTPTGDLTPETYLGVDKAHLYQGTQAYATGAFDVSHRPARRQFRVARAMDTRRSGRHRAGRRRRHRTELPRQGRLPGGRRHRHGDHDPQRRDHDHRRQRTADAARDRHQRPPAARAPRHSSQPRAASLLVHLRLTRHQEPSRGTPSPSESEACRPRPVVLGHFA